MLAFSSLSAARRSALAVAVATAALAITGCASDQDNGAMAPSGSSSSAIQTPGVTHSSAQEQRPGYFSHAFPTGDKKTSTLFVEETLPQQVKVGREAPYQIKVTNLTNQPLRNVRLVQTNGDGFQTTNVTGSTTQPSDNGRLTYQIGDLGPKETRTLSVTGMATRVGTVDTCYAALFAPPTLCTNLTVVNPQLTLEAQAPADVDICQDLTYTYTVTNTGSGMARNVMLTENLPDGLTTTDGQQTVNANLGDVPQGEARKVMAHLKAAHTGSFPGQVTAKSDDDTAQPQQTTTNVHAPTLAVALTGSDKDYVGKQVAYKVVVTNKGDAPAQNVRVKIAASGTGTVTGANGANGGNGGQATLDSNGQASLGTIGAGDSQTFNVMATSNQGGTETLTANATADCTAAVQQTASTEFMTVPSLLLETVDEADPIRVGENVVYDVKVTNQGSGPDTNVRVTATIPDGETFVSATGTTEGTVNGKTITFGTIPTLEAKQAATWKVTVKADRAGGVQFKTSAKSDGVQVGAEKTEPTKLY